MWENLGGEDSSSESSTEDNDDGDGDGNDDGVGNDDDTRKEGAGPEASPVVIVGGDPERRDEEGWACESCTFWNALEVGGRGGTEDDHVQRPRCGVCEAEGPRNARSPWLSA